jgi:uncharacterized protein involved in exopolysaccharide biosynthesis
MKSLRFVIGVFLLLAGIGLAADGVSKLLQRNEYKAAATIKINPPPQSSSSAYDPYFLLTEFDTIQCHAVLSNVVVMLDLDELWSNKYNRGKRLSGSDTEELIRRHLDLRNIRNTTLIEISVFDNDPVEAAKLANAIARQYCKFKAEEFQRRASEAEKSNEPLKFQAPEVVGPAVPQMRPVRPNRYLAAVMLGCGVFLTIGGIVCLNNSESEDPGSPGSE